MMVFLTNILCSKLQEDSSVPFFVRQKLPIFVRGTVLALLVVMVCAILCVRFSLVYAVFGTFISIFLGIVALWRLHCGKWKSASYYSLVSMIVCVLAAVFFGPRSLQSFMIFHVTALLTLLIINGYLCSFSRNQLVICCTVALLIFVVCIPTIFQSYFVSDTRMVLSLLTLGVIVLISLAAVVILIDRQRRDDGNRIVEAEDRASDSLRRLSKLIAESREFFTLGLRLQTETENAQNSLNELSEFYHYLTHQADDLAAAIEIVKKAGVTVMDQTNKVNECVQEQSSSITQTSAAMTQIAATLTNISSIADKRRLMMNNLVTAFNDQHALVAELTRNIGDVKTSSESIAGFVKTVEEIAARTGLLAMNASIEAAHAGVSGKGFAVIAHEIRQLSEQTSHNAAQISTALKSNSAVVANTVANAKQFGTQIEQSTTELNSTAHAMEEILSGISEMNSGTQEIMSSLQNIVNRTHTADEIVHNVVSEVNGQGDSITHMATFADALQERVMNLEMLVGLIQMVITNIKLEAERTTEMSQSIATILEAKALDNNITEPNLDVAAESAKSATRDAFLSDITARSDLQTPCMPAELKKQITTEAASVSEPELPHIAPTVVDPLSVIEKTIVSPQEFSPRPEEVTLAPGEEYIDLDDMLS